MSRTPIKQTTSSGNSNGIFRARASSLQPARTTLTPPLAGALRLRLSRLLRAQRTTYLKARLGSKGAELCAHIDADRSLDELTRTPFTLSVVASLFEAGAKIPSTRIGVLTEVLHLHEQRDEHRNSLEVARRSSAARLSTCRPLQGR